LNPVFGSIIVVVELQVLVLFSSSSMSCE
jgi:hypothetical protein